MTNECLHRAATASQGRNGYSLPISWDDWFWPPAEMAPPFLLVKAGVMDLDEAIDGLITAFSDILERMESPNAAERATA